MPAPCLKCGKAVPAGEFCAACGARQSPGSTDGWLRLSAYAAAPRQRLLRPWLTTSLFPQLPPRSRGQFRVGLIVLAAAAIGFAVLRWQAPVVAVSVFGLPILFALNLREIDARRSLRRRDFALAGVLALGLGVGWALIAGPIVAHAYNAVLGGTMDLEQVLLCGVAIPLTYGLALIAPAAAVRALVGSSGESLDGFTVGAVGAVVVNAATTATLLAPQLAMGVTAEGQSVGGLLAEALVEGIAWPFGVMAVGGVFGISLWFVPASNSPRRYRKSLVVPAALAGVLAFTVAMGVVDVAPLPLGVYIALQLLIAVLAVLAVRIVIADALLHEATRDTADERILCAECGHVVARMGFCSDCGVAVRAASRTSRAARVVGPEAAEALGPEAYEAGPEPGVTALPKRKDVAVLGPLVASVSVAVAIAVVVSILTKPAPAEYACPPDCGGPSTGNPVQTNPRYSGDNGAFSVSYPGEDTAYQVTFDPPGINGVQLKYTGGDTGTITLYGEPARKRAAKQVAEDVLKTKFPRARIAYEIPNASVGYEPGFGVVADVYPRDSSSTFQRLRVIVMAAVRHDYALIATATGPFHEFSSEYGPGHPSGANLEVAMDMGKYVNSFRWFGDRYARPSESRP